MWVQVFSLYCTCASRNEFLMWAGDRVSKPRKQISFFLCLSWMQVPFCNLLVCLTVKLTLHVLFVLALNFIRCAVFSSSFSFFQVMKVFGFDFFLNICPFGLKFPLLKHILWVSHQDAPCWWKLNLLLYSYGHSRKWMMTWHTESLSVAFMIPVWTLWLFQQCLCIKAIL